MPSRLIVSGDAAHFLTERFDRVGNDKIHVQTLAAMNPYASSYEDLFEVAKALSLPLRQIIQLYRQMVINVLSGNVDDHNKNFSFLMAKTGEWSVSPAYDFTYSVDPNAPHYVNRHSMTINGKYEDITKEDLLSVAETFDIKNPGAIINYIIDIVKDYPLFAAEAAVPAPWISLIQSEIAHRLTTLKSIS